MRRRYHPKVGSKVWFKKLQDDKLQSSAKGYARRNMRFPNDFPKDDGTQYDLQSFIVCAFIAGHMKAMRDNSQGAKEMQGRAKQLKRDKIKQGLAMPDDLVKSIADDLVKSIVDSRAREVYGEPPADLLK